MQPSNAVGQIIGKVFWHTYNVQAYACARSRKAVILLGRSSERAVAVAGDMPNPQQVPPFPTFHCTLTVPNKPNILHHLVRTRHVEEGTELNSACRHAIHRHRRRVLSSDSLERKGIPVLSHSPSLPILEGHWWQAKEADEKAQGWGLTPRPVISLHKSQQRVLR